MLGHAVCPGPIRATSATAGTMPAGLIRHQERQEVGSNAIEVHLHHLRRKIGAGLIKNVRGVGYRVVDA